MYPKYNPFNGSSLTRGVGALALCTLATLSGSAQTLLFKSGFEADSAILDKDGNIPRKLSEARDMRGVDHTSGFDWEKDLVSDRDDADAARLGNFNIRMDKAEDGAYVSIIDDPTASGRGKVMKFWMQTPAKLGRVQTNVYGSDEDLNEVTFSVKMYLHPNLLALEKDAAGFDWFTLQELWTNPNWQKSGNNFRISIGLNKRAGVGEKLYWAVSSDEAGKGGQDFWHRDTAEEGIWASDVVGQWVTLVMCYQKGDETTGRFRLKMVDESGVERELFDVTNWTHHPTDPEQDTGLTHHSPQKMYGAAARFDWIREHSEDGQGAAIIYWDDMEYWEGDRYDECQ